MFLCDACVYVVRVFGTPVRTCALVLVSLMEERTVMHTRKRENSKLAPYSSVVWCCVVWCGDATQRTEIVQKKNCWFATPQTEGFNPDPPQVVIFFGGVLLPHSYAG